MLNIFLNINIHVIIKQLFYIQPFPIYYVAHLYRSVKVKCEKYISQMNAHMLLAVLLINAIKTACIINVKNRTLYPLRNTHIILFTLINLLYFLFLLLHLNDQLTETCLI